MQSASTLKEDATAFVTWDQGHAFSLAQSYPLTSVLDSHTTGKVSMTTPYTGSWQPDNKSKGADYWQNRVTNTKSGSDN